MAHNRPVLIRRLREATAADHDAVEGSMPLMRPDLTRQLYANTLARMYGVVAPWEELAERLAPAPLTSLVQERSRRALLAEDLKVLEIDVETLRRAELPEFAGTPELLGAMYVMEGSRLGGQIIARHVEEVLGDLGRRSAAYLRGFEGATGSMWKQFALALEVELSVEETERAVNAARAMFETFGSWMSADTPSNLGVAAAETRAK